MRVRFKVEESLTVHGTPRAYLVMDTWSGMELQRFLAFGGLNFPHLAKRDAQAVVDQLNGATAEKEAV